MNGTFVEGVVRVGGDARQRFHDSRGYGRPTGDGGLELAPVEAAHLLSRGDLDRVSGMGFREFLGSVAGLGTDFLVYADLRERGFYLSPVREGWIDAVEGLAADAPVDLVVHPRGEGPWDGAVAHLVRCVGEREPLPASELGDVVLAVVDEEGECSYFETTRPAIEGESEHALPGGVAGSLHDDRVILWEPPDDLYDRGFFGQRLRGRGAESGPVQLSLVEAAYLAARDAIGVDADGGADDKEVGEEAVSPADRGRALDGERFERRLAVYTALRDRDVVPKTGFKFGADFRTYADVESVADLGHSEHLIRVVPTDHVFSLRDLALDVRLAGGVRKRMVFALADASGDAIDWLAIERFRP